MYLVALLDHLRRNARCLVVVALALTGAFVLPLQVSAAGASERATATTAAPASPVVPGPDERLKPKPGTPECPPVVATCDDLTIDPCIRQLDCPPPPPPPCEEGVVTPECPEPPCDTDHPDCPTPPCDPETDEECRPPSECEEGDAECPEPPDENEPDPGVDRPVPAKPNFTG